MWRRRSETKEIKEKIGESRSWSGGAQSRPEMSGTGYDKISVNVAEHLYALFNSRVMYITHIQHTYS